MKKYLYPVLFVILFLSLCVSLLVNSWMYSKNVDVFKKTIKHHLGFKEESGNPNAKTYAFHYVNDSITPIRALENNETLQATILADTQLMVKPGIYTIDGKTYNLDQEGLYRFMRPETNYPNRQVVVAKNNFLSLISACAWMITHGTRDNKTAFPKWYRKACNEKIIVTCSRASLFTQEMLKRMNVKSRKVQCFSATLADEFFNAHIMLEILHPVSKKWFLVDIDNNRYFTQNGETMNAHEFHDYLQNNQPFQSVRLAQDDWLDADGYIDGMITENLISESHLHQWYKNVTEHVIINDLMNCAISYDSIKKANPNFILADSQKLRQQLYGPEACQ